MKLEAKQRLQSFKLVPSDRIPIALVVRRGEAVRDELTWVHGASADPRITVGYTEYHGKQITFYIFYESVCQGNVVFDFLEGRAAAVKAKVKLTNPASPHAAITPALRGKGITKFLYTQALNSGVTLITDSHSEMAARVWESVSGNPKYRLYHWDHGKVVATPTPTSFKILTKKKL